MLAGKQYESAGEVCFYRPTSCIVLVGYTKECRITPTSLTTTHSGVVVIFLGTVVILKHCDG